MSGIKIGKTERLILPDCSTVNDPRQSIDYGLSYFVGPKDWDVEDEKEVETTFYHESSKQFSKKLKNLSDFNKKR